MGGLRYQSWPLAHENILSYSMSNKATCEQGVLYVHTMVASTGQYYANTDTGRYCL